MSDVNVMPEVQRVEIDKLFSELQKKADKAMTVFISSTHQTYNTSRSDYETQNNNIPSVFDSKRIAIVCWQ